MAKPNPARDYSSQLAEKLGFVVESNYVYRDWRYLYIKQEVKLALQGETLHGWKIVQFDRLVAAGFVSQFPGYKMDGKVEKGVFYITVRLMNDKNPHAKPPKVIEPVKHELPESVAKYITKDLGWKLDKVVAHRIVNGEEPKYAVLMSDGGQMWTVIFVGKYKARRPLGPYEEATRGNAVLVEWDCLSDSDPWEHSVERFRNAPYSYF